MKLKVLSVCLATAIALSLSACDSSKASVTSGDEANVSTTVTSQDSSLTPSSDEVKEKGPFFLVRTRREKFLNSGEFAGVSMETVYEYNSDGVIVSKTGYENDNITVQYLYDDHGNEISLISYRENGSTSTLETINTYDDNGNLIQAEHPRNNGKTFYDNFEYEFDSDGNLITKKIIQTNYITTYTYDSNGKLISERGERTDETNSTFEDEYEYNEYGDVILEKITQDGSTRYIDYVNTYGPQNLLIACEHYQRDAKKISYCKSEYKYDKYGNCIEVKDTYTDDTDYYFIEKLEYASLSELANK